ncbi:MAG: carboxypeptidase regulatory-like domain-containing protein [Planctomycetes bacterium]|nr:carboxypeptidase regulatory-like domain-containing protein [Planctomycetota bacterium]
MRERIPLALLLAFAAPAQSPTPHARLEGIVIDPLERPVANAAIAVERDGVVVATARSDGDGMFVCSRVPPRFLIVQVTTDAPDAGAAPVDLWGEDRGFVRVRIGPARKLSGIVRDDGGEPIAGALVLTSPTGHGHHYAHCSDRTDADGHYELTHVAMGSVTVRAWTDQHDCAAFSERIRAHGDETLDFSLERDAGIWQTFVLENATPEQLARAELRVLAFATYQMPLPPELMRPRAISPGRWEVRGWASTDSIGAWLELDGVTMYPCAQWIEGGVGTTTRRFQCGDADSTITGRLHRDDGEAAPGIALLVQPLAETQLTNAMRRVAISGADGTFAVQAPVVDGDRFALRSLTPSSVVVGNDPSPAWFVETHDPERTWNLAIRDAESIRMRIETETGAPAPGVAIAIDIIETDGQRTIGTGISLLDGNVTIDGLGLSLPATLAVSARGPAGEAAVAMRAGATQRIDLGTIRLTPTATLDGEVLDDDGAAIPGAQVVISRHTGNRAEYLSTPADRAGRFRISGLEPGLYNAGVAGPLQPRFVTFRVVPGVTTKTTLRTSR